jgi:hypothetical protein
MRLPFASRPDREAELFAEASALVDDGLDRDFVLALYPDDADWLAPLLETRRGVVESFDAEQPSYFFEASLKSKFLAAGREAQAPVGEPAAYLAMGRVRTVMASTGVVLAAAVMSVLTLGFVTADGAVPGDWNYSFKLAQNGWNTAWHVATRGWTCRSARPRSGSTRSISGATTSLRTTSSDWRVSWRPRSWTKDKELDDAKRRSAYSGRRAGRLTSVGEKRRRSSACAPRSTRWTARRGGEAEDGSVSSPSPTAARPRTRAQHRRRRRPPLGRRRDGDAHGDGHGDRDSHTNGDSDRDGHALARAR